MFGKRRFVALVQHSAASKQGNAHTDSCSVVPRISSHHTEMLTRMSTARLAVRPCARAAAAAGSWVTPLHRRGYHADLIDHYENPRNVGKLDKKDPAVGTGLVGAPACGDVMQLQIKVSDDRVISETKFKTFGCGSAIASSSLATEWLKGKTLDEAAGITNKEIATELKLPPVKLHCRSDCHL